MREAAWQRPLRSHRDPAPGRVVQLARWRHSISSRSRVIWDGCRFYATEKAYTISPPHPTARGTEFHHNCSAAAPPPQVTSPARHHAVASSSSSGSFVMLSCAANQATKFDDVPSLAL